MNEPSKSSARWISSICLGLGLVLAAPFVASAKDTKSFSGGFSQKSSSVRQDSPKIAQPSAAATKTKTSFGSFGKKTAVDSSPVTAAATQSTPATAPALTQSSLSRDLTLNASKAAALKAHDEPAVATVTTPSGRTDSRAPNYSDRTGYDGDYRRQAALERYREQERQRAAAAATVPPAPTVVYRDSGSSTGSVLTGIAIGSMLSHHESSNAQPRYSGNSGMLNAPVSLDGDSQGAGTGLGTPVEGHKSQALGFIALALLLGIGVAAAAYAMHTRGNGQRATVDDSHKPPTYKL